MYALLLIQILDHRGVLARERAEALFAAGVGKAATIENKSPAVPSLILGPAAMKGKAENAHRQIVCVGSEALQLLRPQHPVECVQQRGKSDGQLDVVQQPAQIFQRVRHALQEVSLALVKTAKTVST